MHKESDIELRFGTCSFKAHVHNIIKQNFFVRIYDVLTDPAWMLEIDNSCCSMHSMIVMLPFIISNSVCSLYMPKEIEISFSEQKEDYILWNRNDNLRQTEENHL